MDSFRAYNIYEQSSGVIWPLTCATSRVCHMEAAISGVWANTASVSSMSAFSSRGTGQPTNPNRDATGNHDWFSYMTIRAFSSCVWMCGGGGGGVCVCVGAGCVWCVEFVCIIKMIHNRWWPPIINTVGGKTRRLLVTSQTISKHMPIHYVMWYKAHTHTHTHTHTQYMLTVLTQLTLPLQGSCQITAAQNSAITVDSKMRAVNW